MRHGDLLKRGPEGRRHGLALIEAADPFVWGDRISTDRLASLISMRLSGVQDDTEPPFSAPWPGWRREA